MRPVVPPHELPAHKRKQVLDRAGVLTLGSLRFWIGILLGAAMVPLAVLLHGILPRFSKEHQAPLKLLQAVCAIVLLMPLAWIIWPVRSRAYRQALIENHLCLRCGYDLTGNVSSICPECGNQCPPAVEKH